MTDMKITPQIRERLAQLESEHGTITPSAVVADAKDKKSPLHNLFDWDVKSAAEKHWLDTARAIIGRVLIVSTTSVTLNAPFYVRDPSAPAKEQGYISVAQLQKDPVAARDSLRLEFGRAESALNRARTLASVLNMEEEINGLIERLIGLKDRLAESAAA